MSVKNVLIPIGIFLYFPFAFYMFLIVWGGYSDMFVRGIYITVSNIISMIMGFIVWFLITAVLVSVISMEIKKDNKFIILSAVPIISFFFLYIVKFFQ